MSAVEVPSLWWGGGGPQTLTPGWDLCLPAEMETQPPGVQMPHHPEGRMRPDLGAHPAPQIPTRPLLSAAQVSTAARTRLAEPRFFSPASISPPPVFCDLLSPWSPLPHTHSCPSSTPVSVSPGPRLLIKRGKGGPG